MKKLLARVGLAVIVLPLLFLVTYSLTAAKFLLLNLAAVGVSLTGALEVRSLVERRSSSTFPWLAPALGAALPAASYLEAVGLISETHLLVWVVGSAALVLLRAIWSRGPEEMDALVGRVGGSLLVMLYPGALLLFVSRLTTVDNAPFHLLFLFALVFGNDTAAWAVGSLFGRPLGLAISPAKSVAGFVAGFAVSLAVALAAAVLWPASVPGGLGGALLVGAVIGVATILGDLVESALKRSAGVKDSGTIMMGRGGLLDSADSLLFAAPLYYLLLGLLGR